MTQHLPKCPSCQAEAGHHHAEGCDVEHCPVCGGQYLSCGHRVPEEERIAWGGIWPGEYECRQLHWLAPENPLQPHLDRLHQEGRWSAAARRWFGPAPVPCPVCKTPDGHFHQAGCEMEQCPECGDYLVICGHPRPKAARIPFAGEYIGEMEAREHGLFYKLEEVTEEAGTEYVPCAPNDPGARPWCQDVLERGRWDKRRRRWLLSP